jgi:hypothetical protein
VLRKNEEMLSWNHPQERDRVSATYRAFLHKGHRCCDVAMLPETSNMLFRRGYHIGKSANNGQKFILDDDFVVDRLAISVRSQAAQTTIDVGRSHACWSHRWQYRRDNTSCNMT